MLWDTHTHNGTVVDSDYRKFPRFPEGPHLHFEKVLHYLLLYKLPQTYWIKTTHIYFSFYGSGVETHLSVLSFKVSTKLAFKLLARAGFSSESSAGKRSASKLIYGVSRISVLPGLLD